MGDPQTSSEEDSDEWDDLEDEEEELDDEEEEEPLEITRTRQKLSSSSLLKSPTFSTTSLPLTNWEQFSITSLLLLLFHYLLLCNIQMYF